MNRSQTIKRSLLLLLVISIGGHHATPIDDTQTKTSVTLSPVNVATELGSTGTSRLPYEERITNTEISRESQTTIDAIVAEETIIYNRFATPPSEYEQYTTADEDPDGSKDHAIPYSEHEEPKDVPTKPNYKGPGTWAKPAKDKNIPLDFVPTKLYAQVRGTHTVKRVPQEEARKSAQSEEEKENAPRLRQVVKNSKVNTVYTEEGYEDSAYDHGGHIRDADFHEGYAKKVHAQADVKKKAKLAEGNDEEKKERKNIRKKQKEFEEYDDDYSDHYESTTPRMELKKLSQSQRTVEEINPKLVAENGIEELERDLDKEVLAVEQGVELNKLPSAEVQNSQSSYKKNRQSSGESNENHSRERLDSRERSNKKSSSLRLPNRQTKTVQAINSDVRKGDSDAIKAQKVNYDAHRLEESPYADLAILEVPTTVNYGQVFWDFYKSNDRESTTRIPLKESLTTLSNIVQTPLPVEVIGNRELYSHSGENQFLTTPSAVEFRISRLKDTLSKPIPNEQYSGAVPNLDYISFPPNLEQQGQPNSWHPLSPSEALAATHAASSNILNKQLPVGTQVSETGALSSTNLKESTGEPENDSHAGTKFRPRYKMVVRERPKKGNPNRRPKQGSSGTTSAKEVQEQSPRNLNSNHKQAKILNHNRNRNTVNPIDSSTQTNTHNHNHKTTSTDINKLRPTYSQGLYGVPFESESVAGSNWQKPASQQYPDFNRQASLYQAPFPIIEPVILTQQRASFPSTKLLPPAPLTSNDYARYQPRNFAPKFRPVAYEGALYRRKRRSTNEFQSSSVKAVKPTKTSTSNRRETEQRPHKSVGAARSRRSERNSLRKAVNTQMGRDFVLDTSGALATEKKFQLHMKGNDGKNLSVKSLPKQSLELIIDRESTVTNNGKKVGTGDPFEEIVKSELNGSQSPSDNSKREKNVTTPEKVASLYSKIVESGISKRSTKERKTNEELLNESPKITEEVIDKEIESRFKDKDESNESESEEDKKGKVEVEVPDFDYVEELVEDGHIEESDQSTTTVTPLNSRKYPFYKDDRISSPALKYAVDPRQLPRKTAGGMEFYRSRDKYKQCSEVEPSLDEVLPDEEEPQANKGLKENLPRLRGLGDKLDCFKAKYFDDNPFDNPLFAEKEIEDPNQPVELDPKGFASRIMVLPEENEDYIVQKSSRKPERLYQPVRNPHISPTVKVSNIQPPSQFDPRKERGRTHHNRVRTRNRPSEAKTKLTPFTVVEPPNFYPARQQVSKRPVFPITENPITNTIKLKESRQVFPVTKQTKVHSNTQQSKRQPFRLAQFNVPPQIEKQRETPVSMSETLLYSTGPYESQVYEDVMGNIRQMASSYKVHEDLEMASKNAAINLPSKIKTKVAIPALNYYKQGNQGGSLDIAKLRTGDEDFISPQYIRYPRTRTRNRSHQDIRPATPKSSTDSRVIGHYQTIRIHKRSTENESVPNKSLKNSTEKILIKRNNDLINKSPAEMNDQIVDESVNVRHSINKGILIPNAEQRSKRRTTSRNGSVNDSSRTENTEDNTNSGRTTYTIRDRIRHSKPKEEITRVGKFSANETLVDVDHRRKEPRYNHIRRRKPNEEKSSLTAAPRQVLLNKSSALRRGNKVESRTDEHSYPADKAQTEVEQTQDYNYNEEILKIMPKSKSENNLSNKSIKNSDEIRARVPKKGYAVYEKAEDENPVTARPIHPRYTQESTATQNHLPLNTPKNSDSIIIDKGEKVEKNEQKNKSKEDKESSEDDDSSNGDKSSEKTFFWYNSRPSSPAENYEDEEFMDLGPRINKPEFYHPPFFVPRLEKLLDDDELNNSQDEGERKSNENSNNAKYDVFPWFRDSSKYNEDIRKSRYRIENTEFPWEKRAREKLEKLNHYDDDGDSEDSVSEKDDSINHKNGNTNESAQKERNHSNKKHNDNRKEKYTKLDDFDEKEDSSDSVSDGHSEYIYPWDKSPPKSRKGRRSTWKNTEIDNESSSSEIRPMRYSSRYKLKAVSNPAIDKPLASAATTVHEVIEPHNETINATTNQPISSETTDAPVDQKSRSTATEIIRGISRGMIVPEDVTLAPRRIESKQFAARIESLKNYPDELKPSKSKNDNIDLNSKEDITNITDNKLNITNTVSTTEIPRRRRRPSKASSLSSTINRIIETSTDPSSGLNKKPRRRQRTTTTTSTMSPTLTSIPSTSTTTETTTIAMTSEASKHKEEDAPTTAQPNSKKPREHRSRTTRRKIASSTISPQEEISKQTKEKNGSKKVTKRIRTVIRRKINKPGKEVKSVIESVKEEVPMRVGKDGMESDRSAVIERHQVKMTYLPDSMEENMSDEESSTTATIQSKKTKIRKSDLLDSLAVEDKSNEDVTKKQENDSKAEAGYAPTNGVVKLSEHTSREVISSVSWMSEKYSF